MAGVTLLSRRDSHTCHGDARGRDTPSPPKGALGGVTTSLTEIADRLERLAPSSRNPMHFHEEKSELIFALRRAAAVLDQAGVLPHARPLRGEASPGFSPMQNLRKGGQANG